MALTSRIGTSDSRYGNIDYGQTVVTSSSYDVTLTLPATAGITLAVQAVDNPSLTLNPTAGFSSSGGPVFNPTFTLSATAGLTLAVQADDNPTLTLNPTAGFSTTGQPIFNPTFALSAIAGLTLDVQAVDEPALTLSETADFSATGGSDFQVSTTEAAAAGFSATGQPVFNPAFTLPAIAGLALDVQADDNPSLTLNPTAAFSPSVQAVDEPALTLSESAGFSVIGGSDFLATDTESATAGFSPSVQSTFDPARTMSATAGMTIDPGLAGNPNEALAGISNFALSVTATFARSSANSFVISQSTSYLLVKVVSVHNTLNLHQHVSLPGNEAFDDTLSFTQTATYSRIINQAVSNTFAPTQAVNVNKTVSFTVNHTLVFQDTYLRVTPIAGLVIPVPQAMATVVNRHKCTVIMQAAFGVIVLPCPQLGDRLSNSGLELKIKYSTNGQAYTYARKTDLQKLNYTFWLERKKSLELRAFLTNYNQSNEPLTLTNWKGEVWIVNIVSSPVSLTGKARWAPCGEQVSVTMEFEGIKIMG